MIPCHGHEPQQKNPKPTTATQRKPPWQVNPLNKIGKKRGTKRAYPLRVLSSKSSCHPNFLWKRERERERKLLLNQGGTVRNERRAKVSWVWILETLLPAPKFSWDPALSVIRKSRQASWEHTHTIEGHWRSIAKSTECEKPEWVKCAERRDEVADEAMDLDTCCAS